MSDHRRETILANLKTTLAAVSSIPNVQRWNHRGNPILEVPAVIISSGREEKDPSPYPQMTCHFTVFLDLWYRQDDSEAETDTDTILNALLLDIEKALAANSTLSGACENIIERANTPFETVDEAPHCGLTIELDILYKHKQIDPSLRI